MTRLGDLMHFGQLFKACGNNYFFQIAFIIIKKIVKAAKSLIFQVKSFLWATFIDIWRLFTGHTALFQHLIKLKLVFYTLRP